MAKSVGAGLLLTWAAHALLPGTDAKNAEQLPAPVYQLSLVARQAMASAAILLLMVALCLSDPRLATAMVVPITVASLLSQFELGMSGRAAQGLVALLVLLVSLFFAGNAALGNATGRVFGSELITFLILFGLGISPLPNSAAELFSTRIVYVLLAIVYALGMAALLWPRPPRLSEAIEAR